MQGKAMKRGWIGALLVAVGVVALIAYKELWSQPTPSETFSTASTEPPSVILVADPREAESTCGCGDIIRAVRAAGERGVVIREVMPGSAESRAYRVTVSPTVLFLDPQGTIVARHEGEGPATISAIRARLDQASADRQ
jgi:hypothetical protein